jgi:geranylgeranylglycerol-phosphate geranylgeranyltransferase
MLFSWRDSSPDHGILSSLRVSTSTLPKPVDSVGPVKALGILMKSEYRVSVFVFSLITAYLLATNLSPNFLLLGELVVAWYSVTFGVYVFNGLTDVKEDRIDHPNRPFASGKVSERDGWIIFATFAGISFVVSIAISVVCFILILSAFLLGVAYSHPAVRAKRRFPLKILVSIPGAVLCSLCGGIVAGNLDGPVIFSAIFFGLFALVTLLLGDVSDVPGDTAAGVRSLPIVIGQKNAVSFIIFLPLTIAFLGLALFETSHLNPAFPLVILAITSYSTVNIAMLLEQHDDYLFAKKVKSRLRLIHFALQLSLILGLLTL